jgi:hypothetical protein
MQLRVGEAQGARTGVLRASKPRSVAARAAKEVTLLDYGAGNVRSVRNAITKLGYTIKDVGPLPAAPVARPPRAAGAAGRVRCYRTACAVPMACSHGAACRWRSPPTSPPRTG